MLELYAYSESNYIRLNISQLLLVVHAVLQCIQSTYVIVHFMFQALLNMYVVYILWYIYIHIYAVETIHICVCRL